jgi:hypothetical protein
MYFTLSPRRNMTISFLIIFPNVIENLEVPGNKVERFKEIYQCESINQVRNASLIS